jgi:hypothetical protein
MRYYRKLSDDGIRIPPATTKLILAKSGVSTSSMPETTMGQLLFPERGDYRKPHCAALSRRGRLLWWRVDETCWVGHHTERGGSVNPPCHLPLNVPLFLSQGLLQQPIV